MIDLIFECMLLGVVAALAARQSNVALLRRAVLANLLWEDVAYLVIYVEPHRI